MRRVVAVLCLAAMAAASLGSANAAAGGNSSSRHVPSSAVDPRAVRWLAMGDSFSSGEGIPGAAAGNPDLQGKDNCQRANGDDTNAKAFAVVAVEQLQASPPSGLTFERPFFVACTGAISDDAATQLDEMRAQVPGELQRWDVVSVSFGGNNVLFEEVIEDCLDITDAWGYVMIEGCDVSDAQLRARVDMLVGRATIVDGEFEGTTTLPQLYDQIAAVVQPGGHVIVAGYPHLIEEPERWASWMQRRSLGCQGVLQRDVRMLRGVTGYLNEQIALAVEEADRHWRPRGVTFDFVDLATKVYETSTDGADRHGLCAADQWINGLTVGITSGDFRKERSFHPTQAGHDATGRYLAQLIRDTFSFVHEGPTVVETGVGEWTITFDHPSFGRSRLVTRKGPDTFGATLEGFGEDGTLFYARTEDDYMDLWPSGVHSGSDVVGGTVDGLGHIFVNYSYGRDPGILIFRPTAEGFQVFDFYDADLVDLEGDGVFEVEDEYYDCDPTCAGAPRTVEVFAWNGSDYVLTGGFVRSGSQRYAQEPITGNLMLYHRGSRVQALQALLRTTGELTTEPDWEFGPSTEAAVRRFQRSVGLPAHGIADAETFHALDMAAGGVGFASLDDADRTILDYLNGGPSLPNTGWLAEDLLRVVADPGDRWESTGSIDDPPELSYAYLMGDIGVVSVLRLGFRQVDGRYWYWGIRDLYGH